VGEKDGEMNDLTVLEHAYITMLKMSFSPMRAKSQLVLASMRDLIAAETGKDEEEVQNYYESIANE